MTDIVKELRQRIIVDGMEMPGNDELHRRAADEIERLRAECKKANARERPAFEAGYDAGADTIINCGYPDAEYSWQQYRCKDDTDWRVVADSPNTGEDKTGFERNCKKCGKEYGGLGIPFCPECCQRQMAGGEPIADSTGEEMSKIKLSQLDAMIARLTAENERLRAVLLAIRTLVDTQAEDEGLWFVAEYATEAYLQRHLRELHALIEALTPDTEGRNE